MTYRSPIPGRLVLVTVAILVGVVGCSSAEGEPTGQPSIDTEAQFEQLYSQDARPDQQSAAQAATRAASFGFGQQVVATEEEIQQARQDSHARTRQAGQNQVDPPECTAALDALDWSPVLAGTDHVTRVDFTSETFPGAGTVEVAAAEEISEEIQRYHRTVDELVGDCAELTIQIADPAGSAENPGTIGYQFRAERLETEAGPALQWARTPLDSRGNAVSALVLMQEHDDLALMVSFVGDTSVHDEEFQQIASEIMEAMINPETDVETDTDTGQPENPALSDD